MLLSQLNNVLMLAAASCQNWLVSLLHEQMDMERAARRRLEEEEEQRSHNTQLSVAQQPQSPTGSPGFCWELLGPGVDVDAI